MCIRDSFTAIATPAQDAEPEQAGQEDLVLAAACQNNLVLEEEADEDHKPTLKEIEEPGSPAGEGLLVAAKEYKQQLACMRQEHNLQWERLVQRRQWLKEQIQELQFISLRDPRRPPRDSGIEGFKLAQ